MFSRSARLSRRRVLGAFSAVAASVMLSACDPVGFTPASPRVDATAPVQVALLVPGGSGDPGRQVLASSLENAARLAVSDLSGVQIDLRVFETAGDPERAAAAAERAVGEGARIILGPVFSAEARAVGAAVAGRGVNVLSFSNNTEIAGGNVFVLGHTFENTARRLLDHAAREGRGQIMVVSERTEEGAAAEAAINRAAARSGSAAIVATERYAFSQQGIVEALPAIASAARSTGAQTILFTANSAGALPILAQLLPENRVGPPRFQFMGLTRWDIPPATLALRGLQGGWFALPDPDVSARFQQRYNAAYGNDPHPIAGLAYDGVAAIGALLGTDRRDALSAEALTQGSGFVGVGGVFRLRPDGGNERGLAVATIRDEEVIILDAAPRAFTGAGS